MATFVLVPGAWLGGWCWRDVTRLIRGAGHDAVAVTLTGLAERSHLLTPEVGLDTHVEDAVRVLVDEDLHDVILVGHSYGGTVTTVAAGRVPERLRGLAYLDATIPTNGQSNNDVLPPRIANMVRELARECGDGWRVPPPPAIDWGLDDETRAWIVPKLAPHPLKSLEDPARFNPGILATLPCSFLRTSPPTSVYQTFLQRARAEGWRCRELSGGHYAMLAVPHVVATALLELADERGAGRTRGSTRR
jgi:pimeloyl-ACP methyl ester carboxylesterase